MSINWERVEQFSNELDKNNAETQQHLKEMQVARNDSAEKIQEFKRKHEAQKDQAKEIHEEIEKEMLKYE